MLFPVLGMPLLTNRKAWKEQALLRSPPEEADVLGLWENHTLHCGNRGVSL